MTEKITELIWLSSMAKVFPDEEFKESIEGSYNSFFVNEVFSIQLGINSEGEDNSLAEVSVSGSLAGFVTVREVISVPVRFAAKAGDSGAYLKKSPGLYPDLLRKLTDKRFRLTNGYRQSLHFTFDLRETDRNLLKFGKNDLIVTLTVDDKTYSRQIEIELLKDELPKLDIYHTEWFHSDCLADYYRVDSLSEKHWEIMSNYI